MLWVFSFFVLKLDMFDVSVSAFEVVRAMFNEMMCGEGFELIIVYCIKVMWIFFYLCMKGWRICVLLNLKFVNVSNVLCGLAGSSFSGLLLYLDMSLFLRFFRDIGVVCFVVGDCGVVIWFVCGFGCFFLFCFIYVMMFRKVG